VRFQLGDDSKLQTGRLVFGWAVSEDGGQKTDDRGQRTEDGRQRTGSPLRFRVFRVFRGFPARVCFGFRYSRFGFSAPSGTNGPPGYCGQSKSKIRNAKQIRNPKSERADEVRFQLGDDSKLQTGRLVFGWAVSEDGGQKTEDGRRVVSSIFPRVLRVPRLLPSRLLVASLLVLLGAASLFAAETNSAALPQPATNVVEPSPTPAASGQSPGLPIPPVATNGAKPGPTNSMDALDDKHKLAIGDRLSFRIVEDEEDPKPLFVTDSGDLEVPYIGRFPAVGKSCKELASALKAELEKEYYYLATVVVAVDIMTKSRGKVYLVGPVRAPGPQEIPSDEILTLSKAILRAGGFGDYADKHKVRVTRKTGATGGRDQTFTVNVSEILEKGKTESDLPLEPGDLIYIPERLIRF